MAVGIYGYGHKGHDPVAAIVDMGTIDADNVASTFERQAGRTAQPVELFVDVGLFSLRTVLSVDTTNKAK